MRSTLFLLLSFLLLGTILWITLSGASLVVGALFWLVLAAISVSYEDTCLLYLLGAREVRSSDEKDFFEAAFQEAYKLGVKMPRLYFYNGTLDRAFILQNKNTISIVLSKNLIENCSRTELSAVCFELLLQVKKRMAPKRTRTMFLLGLMAWTVHSINSLFLLIVPIKEVKEASSWFINYMIHPWLDFMFRVILGESYFKKLKAHLNEFPNEKEQLERVGLRLRKPQSYYSLPSRKLMELSSSYKSRHFQRIMALEFLPHEWDYLFADEELVSAQ